MLLMYTFHGHTPSVHPTLAGAGGRCVTWGIIKKWVVTGGESSPWR